MDEETSRLESASDWLMRLEKDDLCADEIVQWVQWCEADPQNRSAFERLLPLWHALDATPLAPDRAALLSSMPRETLTHLREQLQCATLESGVVSSEAAAAANSSATRRVRSTSFWVGAGLAATMLLVIGALGARRFAPTQPLRPVSQLNSAVAVNRVATLPDGSSLTLGAHSAIAIDFLGAHRTVQLNEGEAFFAVKHDKLRPFVVHAGSLSVTAIGTRFDVLCTGTRVSVTVEEGLVRVATDSSSNLAVWNLMAPAGHQVVYDAAQRAGPSLRVVDPAAATAWQQGRLEYIEEPLSAVIANLNRYSSRRIMLRDTDASQLAYTGTIEVRSIDEWLHALPRIFPVRVASGGGDDQSIIIESRSQAAAAR